MFTPETPISDLIQIIALPFLWIVIAIIFLLIWIAGQKAKKDIDSILSSQDLGRGMDSSGHLVIIFNIDQAMQGLGSVIKKVNNLSGYAALVSVFAAMLSAIVSLL